MGKRAARTNIQAIRVLKEVESENRPATPEEQTQLVKYLGWGSMSETFNTWRTEWDAIRKELQGVLDADEYQAAADSTSNAMYTPPRIIKAMYAAVIGFGFRGGSVLEPASGVGHFFGLMPPELRKLVTRVGIEKDSISARIGALLYPRSDMRRTPFEEAQLPKDYFTLAISNVPFGNVAIFDPRYPQWATAAIHDYFFIRSLDLVRPGGVVAFITSNETMDKATPYVRQGIAERADLLGAVRLNNKSLPGTQVVADIIFLRKRLPGEEPGGEAWLKSPRLPELRDYTVNEYFHAHPEMVLGTFAPGTFHARGARITVNPRSKEDPLEGLAEAVAALPHNVMTEAGDVTAPKDPADLVMAPTRVPVGSFFRVGDKVHYKGESETAPPAAVIVRGEIQAKERAKAARKIKPGQKRPALLTASQIDKLVAERVELIGAQVELRDVVLELLHRQAVNDAEGWKGAQRDLTRIYDAFVKKYGYLHKPKNVRALGDDYHTAGVLDAVEVWDPKTKRATKAPIFERRMIAAHERKLRAESPQDAINTSMNEYGKLDLAYMAQLLETTPAGVKQQLLEGALAFESPAGELVVRDEYLSGNVRQKLADAEAAAQMDPDRYRGNVEALREVIPKDLTVSEITPQLGAPWIPQEIVQAFGLHLFGATERGGLFIRYIPELGKWIVRGGYEVSSTVAARSKWGMPDRPGPQLLGDALSNRAPIIKVQVGEREDGTPIMEEDPIASDAAAEKIKVIRAEFERWIWSEPKRTNQLVKAYNFAFNNQAPRDYDGSYLTFPGMSPTWNLYDYQRNAVAFNLQRGSGLVNLEPGAGKTMIAIATARELVRLGMARKPMIVVQASTLEQFRRDAKSMYPGHSWTVLTEQDTAPANLRKTLAKIATTESTVVIMSHERLLKLPMSAEYTTDYFEERINDLSRAKEAAAQLEGEHGRTAKELGKARARMRVQLQKRLHALKQMEGMGFEQLGIDYVIYDESQRLKNLAYQTQMQRVKGLGPTEGNNTTFDAEMKTKYLLRLQNGRGVLFQTATPVSNSMVELYNLTRFLAPTMLEGRGITTFDQWVGSFGSVESDVESLGEGGYRDVRRLRDYVNVDDFMAMYADHTYVVSKDDVHARWKAEGRPAPLIAKNADGERTWRLIVSPPNAAHEAYVKTIKARAEALKKRKRRPRKGEDNILNVITDNRIAGLDLKLRRPDAPRHPEDKISRLAQEIITRHERDAGERLTQLVAMSFGIPKPGEYSTYHELRDLLVEGGIPKEEIAILQEVSAQKRQELFDKMNRGDVRVLMGTIQLLGIGVNVQARLKTLHLADPAYTPDRIEQIQGRAVRPGNMNTEVELLAYVQKGSADEFMYSLAFHKWRFQGALLSGTLKGARTFQDVDVIAGGFEAAMAHASRAPVVLEWTKARKALQHLQRLKTAHEGSQRELRAQLGRLQELADRIRTRTLPAAQRGAKLVGDAAEQALQVTVGGVTYTKPGEAGVALNDAVMAMPLSSEFRPLGTVNGVEIEAAHEQRTSVHETYDVAMFRLAGTSITFGSEQGGHWYPQAIDIHPKLKKTGASYITRDAKRLLEIPAQRAERLQERLEKTEAELASGEKELGPFAREADLAEYTAKEAKLSAQVEALGAEPVKPGDTFTMEGTEYKYVRSIGDEIELDIMAAQGPDVGEVGDVAVAPEAAESRRFPRADLVAKLKREFELTEDKPGTSPDAGEWRELEQEGYRPANWLAGVPANQRASLLKWIREHGPDHPAYGMGAMFNFPDVRGTWTRIWDGFADSLRSLPPGLRKKVVDAIGRAVWGTDRWNVDPDAWRAIQRYHGGMREAKYDADKITGAVEARMGELEKMYGPGARETFNNLLTDVAEGREDPARLDPVSRQVYERYRAKVNQLTDEFLNETHLHSYAEGFGLTNLLEIIQRKRESPGAYLRMIFREQYETEWAEGTHREKVHKPRKKLEERKRIRAIQGGMFKHRASADLWTVRNFDGTFTQFTDADRAYEHAREQIDNPELKERYGTSLEQRVRVTDPFGEEALGHLVPEKNILVRMGRTITDWRHNLEVLRLFWYIDQTVANAERVADDWVRTPRHPRWGPLAEKYIPRELADGLMETIVVRTGLLSQLYDSYLYAWKASKVVYNPSTWGRNMLGLNFFWLMDGIHPVKDARWFVEAVRHFREGTPTFRRLLRENEISAGYAETEIDRIDKLIRDPQNTVTTALAKFLSRLDRITRKTGNLYDLPDQISKMASYLRHTSGQGWSHEEAVAALQGYPNYARRGNLTAWARRSPFGASFIAFAGASVQVNLHYARTRPGRLLMMWLLPGLTTLLTSVILGLEDEEIALVNHGVRRKTKSPLGRYDPFAWMDRYFMPLLPWRDDQGRVRQLDLRWIFPLANDFRVNTGPGGFGIPLLLSQPLTKTGIEIAMNRSSWTGRDIAREHDEPVEKVRAIAKHVFEGVIPLPTITTRGARRIYLAATGDERYPLIKTILKELFGINVSAPWIRREDAFRMLKEMKGEKAAKAFEVALTAYNEIYRSDRDKRIKSRAVSQSLRQGRRRELRSARTGRG